MIKTRLLTFIAALCICAASNAQSISVSFAGDNGGGTGFQIAAGQTAGVSPANDWEDATGASGAITTASGAGVTWASNNTWGGSGATSDDEAMVNGWLDDGGPGASVQITGITYPLYDVYVYGSSDAGNEGRGWTTNVNGTDYYSGGSFAALTPNGSFFSNAYVDASGAGDEPTYFKISGLSGDTLDLLGSRDTAGPALPNGITDYRAAISGFQIVAVPEPVSGMLALTALIGLLGFRRRS